MPEGSGRAWRFAAGSALALLILVEINALAVIQAGQSRAREAAVSDLRDALHESLPRLQRTLERDGPDACARHARQRLPGVAEVEILDSSGAALAATPFRIPVAHKLDAGQQARLVDAGITSVGPIDGPSFPRVLVLVLLRASGGFEVVLRVSKDARDLAADIEERRWLYLLHGVALVLLAMVGLAAALASTRPTGADASGAMAAYETAMAQLADHRRRTALAHASQMQHLQETLQSQEAMARAGELTSGMVHEVRNGLGTIAGNARLVQAACAERRHEDAEAASAGILDECRALEAIVRRFAEFVRTERLRRDRVDVRRIVERVIARDPRPLAAVVLEGPGTWISADEDLLERALDNLVRNAREAAGPEGRVTVALNEEPSCVRVDVSDDGPGLPVDWDDAPRPFRTTKADGLGLGLPTALKVVHLHGGELVLKPRVPRGLTVSVLLPKEPPSATNGNGPPAPPRAPGHGTT